MGEGALASSSRAVTARPRPVATISRPLPWAGRSAAAQGSPSPRKRPPPQLPPPRSSPAAAAFLRWAISSLLCLGNANSCAVWKEVPMP